MLIRASVIFVAAMLVALPASAASVLNEPPPLSRQGVAVSDLASGSVMLGNVRNVHELVVRAK